MPLVSLERASFCMSLYDSAFTAHYQAYYQNVVRWIYGLIPQHETAEDLAQWVFLSAWRAYTPEKAAYIWPWLRAIARNRVIDWYRKHGDELLIELEAEEVQQLIAPLPPEEYYTIQESVEEILAKLTPKQRSLLMLLKSRYSLMECAEILGISYASVRDRIDGIRKKLGVPPLRTKRPVLTK